MLDLRSERERNGAVPDRARLAKASFHVRIAQKSSASARHREALCTNKKQTPYPVSEHAHAINELLLRLDPIKMLTICSWKFHVQY